MPCSLDTSCGNCRKAYGSVTASQCSARARALTQINSP